MAERGSREASAERHESFLAGELRFALRTLLPYAVFGVLWVVFADRVVATLVTDSYQLEVFQQYKAWFFVAISIFLIYLLVRGENVRRLQSERKFAAAFGTIPDPMAIVRLRDGRVLDVNSGFVEQLGYAKSQIRGGTLSGRGLWPDPSAAKEFAEVVRDSGVVHDYETVFITSDGSRRDVLVSGRVTRIGRADCVVFLAKDITQQRETQARLEHLAFHDTLTDLPNRALLLDRLGHALARARRRDTGVAILCMNLDRFKVINHTFGHEAGDDLLVQVALRIGDCLRQEDTVTRSSGTLSRIGADEFTVVLGEISAVEDALGVVKRIERAFEKPFRVQGEDVSISMGIGAAYSPDGSGQPESLLRQAGIALRRAKATGLARHHVFDAGVDSLEARRLRLENDLREAVSRDELELLYQPIIDLGDGSITGFEALVRWNHPQLGLLSPMEFIPIAEESGLVLRIGRWVLRQACEDARRWNDELATEGSLTVAVNVSAEELRDPGLEEAVSMVLLETGLDARRLQIEVTESLFLRSIIGVRRLKHLDVKVVIDDFGTAYSSLNYLARFPVDAIKVDQTLVGAIGRDPEVRSVVGAMAAMAGTLDLDLVAEGIETRRQLETMRELGCTYGQGYYFRRPLRGGEIGDLLSDQPLEWGATAEPLPVAEGG